MLAASAVGRVTCRASATTRKNCAVWAGVLNSTPPKLLATLLGASRKMASDTLRHATIIAGGIGSRAHGMTRDRIPKALLPVAGVPILFRQLQVLAREGIAAVTVLAGHLGDQLAP